MKVWTDKIDWKGYLVKGEHVKPTLIRTAHIQALNKGTVIGEGNRLEAIREYLHHGNVRTTRIYAGTSKLVMDYEKLDKLA